VVLFTSSCKHGSKNAHKIGGKNRLISVDFG
jgi:hypothetical protein